jgi:metal-sulfur cluster biosynthetic enzyme
MQLTKDDILKALSEVYDPEIPINIVDMGLIYKVEVDPENNVEIDMTMTTRGCPMHSMITYQAQKRLEGIEGAGKVKVNLVWNPPWTPEMISPKIREQILKGDE